MMEFFCCCVDSVCWICFDDVEDFWCLDEIGFYYFGEVGGGFVWVEVG